MSSPSALQTCQENLRPSRSLGLDPCECCMAVVPNLGPPDVFGLQLPEAFTTTSAGQDFWTLKSKNIWRPKFGDHCCMGHNTHHQATRLSGLRWHFCPTEGQGKGFKAARLWRGTSFPGREKEQPFLHHGPPCGKGRPLPLTEKAALVIRQSSQKQRD